MRSRERASLTPLSKETPTPELEKTLSPSADVRSAAPTRSGFFADLGRWLLKTPTLALLVFATPFYLAAAPLFLLFAIGKERTESPLLFASVAVASTFCVALPPQLAFVAILTLPYLAAATFPLWASSALEILRGFNAS